MRNVTVQDNAFVFCRYSVAVLVWSSLVFRSIYPLWAVLAVMALSAVLGVDRAPLVWLWTNTLGRVVPSKDVVLDLRGMRISHAVASGLAVIAIIGVWREQPWAWWFVGGLALLKTFSAVAGCPLYKLYGCTIGGGKCCSFLRAR